MGYCRSIWEPYTHSKAGTNRFRTIDFEPISNVEHTQWIIIPIVKGYQRNTMIYSLRGQDDVQQPQGRSGTLSWEH